MGIKKSESLQPVAVLNYSGTGGLAKLNSKIDCLKKNNYKIVKIALTGDAPKDFIRVYEYNGKMRRDKLKTWTKYIAKVGHKWYPLESITEYLMNKIGEKLGFNMANSKLVLISNQVRFLSEYFLEEDEELVHGAEIFSSFLSEENTKFIDEIERKKLTQTLLTFEFTRNAIRNSFPTEYEEIMADFVKMLLLDAIIGNSDRHFYNWGVIKSTQKGNKHRFSPIYDTARGLFWNTNEDDIARKYYIDNTINQQALDNYIRRSRPKVGIERNPKISHFELIQFLYEKCPEYSPIFIQILNSSNLETTIQGISKDFKQLYTQKRWELMINCLSKRFHKLQMLLKI